MNKYGYLRVAAAYPKVELADPAVNSVRISDMIMSLSKKGARLIVFPELCLTGYTCGDLFNQPTLLNSAMRQLGFLQQVTKESHVTAVVGLPVRYRGRLYNCAAVIQYGEILGIVPKCYLPNYDEFYEKRWFSSGLKLDLPAGKEYNIIDIDSHAIPFGINLLFRIENAKFGVEICEDMWVPNPPSTTMSVAGADIIANLSATNEVINKHAFLLSLIKERSSRCKCGYVYASAGAGESSSDLVFSGNAIIAEDGQILKKSDRFRRVEGYCIADIDVEKLRNTRQRQSSFGQNDIVLPTFGSEEFTATQAEPADLMRDINPYPFMSSDKVTFEEQCEEIITIQAWGLEQRLLVTHCKCLVVGISGGLDSTLALLVAIKAFDNLGLDRKGIIGVTMPGFGTSERTHSNATELMERMGITHIEINIADAVKQHFKDIDHDINVHDATYENAQARERTQILMDLANKYGGMVLGTGDLSELALGWCTYNGDHMSMYSVNASVPKTLIRPLVRRVAQDYDEDTRRILEDIVSTPISPELVPTDNEGNIAQKTEDLVGPYDLHDFFIYHFVKEGFPPSKIFTLACKAFAEGPYDDDRPTFSKQTIKKWLIVFFRRFFNQQFKRSCMPDGPKVGPVSFSPRGDWRMPSDAVAKLWISEAESIQA
ncbi:MAG: NAD(+) synthase [Muribaculaceae bacterium]|nr:NAD(+) synthase [Muribaculaceae bacterium]